MKSITAPHEAAGYAAFTLVQLLMEHLVEKKVLTKEELLSICTDAAERHEKAAPDTTRPEVNAGAAKFIRALIEVQ